MMYALIYDDHDLEHRLKRVTSVHETRAEAEGVLAEHWKTHGKRLEQCNMRVVWIEEQVAAGDSVTPNQFETWRPGEPIPEGELHSDED